MRAPTSQFSQLSLEGMPPTTRSKSRAASMATSSYQSDDESSLDSESNSDMSAFDQDAPTMVRSPSKLLYRLDKLSDQSRNHVRDVFSDPPKIALQRCRLIDDTYAFQMTELVTRSIRIRASGDGSSRLSCSCKGPGLNDSDHEETCPHLLWLLDQLLKETLYDYDQNEPLVMKPSGFAEEMGDPFRKIASHHLDILAAGLHCPLLGPESDGQVDPTRVVEACELLSSIYSTAPENFRPDIFNHPTTGRKVIKRNDLGSTIFRMLLDNSHFFNYFLSHCRPFDPINDPFRKVSQRVDLVLRNLDGVNAALDVSETSTSVPWAANHILGCVGLVRSAVFSRDRPLHASETLSAVSTLVRILDGVVTRNHDTHRGATRLDRNIYLRLIGDRDQDFIIGVLALLPEAASQFLHNLDALLDQISIHGAPASYVEKFRSLLSRLRTSRGNRLKRQGQGQPADRRSSKRMK